MPVASAEQKVGKRNALNGRPETYAAEALRDCYVSSHSMPKGIWGVSQKMAIVSQRQSSGSLECSSRSHSKIEAIY